MNRFVVISDLHAHPWAAFSTGEGASNSRLKQTLFVLQASLVKAHHLEIPWLFAGDLVHTSGYMLNEVLNSVGRILNTFPDVLKIAVWGNHDARGRRTELTLQDTVYPILMSSVPNLHVLHQDNPYYHYKNVVIAGAGYQPSPTLLNLPEGDIGLYHQTVRGSITAHGFALEEGIDRERVGHAARVAIVGHVHHPQELPSPEGRAILIPGSPEHHNFGDMGDHGWWILSLPDSHTDAPKVEFIAGGSPEFRTVDSAREISGDHYYRVRTVTEGERLPHGVSVIAPAPTTIRSRDLLRGAAQVEQVLAAWLKHAPPGAGINVTDCMDVGTRILVEQDPVQLRPVKLQSIELRNFCSYDHTTLCVQDGIWLVTGKGRDFTSNGAGKTTLVGEALYWLLFGRNTKGMSSQEVIRNGTAGCIVTALFRDGDYTMEVTRARNERESVLLVKQGGVNWEATSVDAMTKKLNRFLGVTPEIFQNLAYFSQEKLLLFSSATDGERKSVLADLVGLTAYQNAGSAASDHVSRFEEDEHAAKIKQELLESEARALVVRIEEKKADVKAFEDERGGDLLEVNFTLLHNEKRKDNPANTAVRLAHVLARTEAVQEVFNHRMRGQVDEYTERFRNVLLMQAQDQIKNARVRHDNLFSQLPEDIHDQVNVRLPKLDELRAKIDTDLSEALTFHARLSAEYHQFLGRAGGLKSLAVHTREQLRRVEGDLDRSTCYVCGQAIDESHRDMCIRSARTSAQAAQEDFEAQERLAKDASQKTADAEQLTLRLKREKQAIENTILQVQGFQKQLTQCETIQREIEELERQQLTQVTHAAHQLAGQQIEKEIQDRHIRLERTRNRIIRAAAGMNNQWRDEQARLLREKQAIEERNNPHTETLIAFENRHGELTERIEDAEDEIVSLQRTIKLYQYWVHGFSRQGIQSLLIEEIATWFNAVRSEVFPTLTQGVYDVQFSTVSFTKAGEPREKTEFRVYEHGVEIPYGITSGGQRRRIDLGIMLTLTLAVSRWMNVPGVLGLITLDEVFGFLDDSGAEGLLATLQQIQNHIPVIFAVTHDQHLQSLFPQVITVEQDGNGTSRIVSD